MESQRSQQALAALHSFLNTPLDSVLSRHFDLAPDQAALALFHTVAANVPAYRAFLAEHGIDPSAIQTFEDFKTVPAITKQNYQSHYPLADLCRDGQLASCDFIAVSSGSTGQPTFWPRFISDELSIATQGKAIVVTDVGQHQMVTCRYAKFNETKSNITSGGLGTMGFALPAAIGAKFGAPKRTVVAIIGDGGFQMTIQELGTIMQSGIDVKIIILNNNFLGMVRQWQQLFHEKRYSFVDITSPDFVQVAKGYHIEGRKVSERDELQRALKEMLDHKGSYLLEVMVGKENNVFPMVPQGCSVAEIRLK